MARLPRFDVAGEPQHVIVRGNNRAGIFGAEADYRFYLDKLQSACDRHACAVHAYVLMTDHVHLLVTPLARHSLSRMLQSLGRCYVQYFNRRYQRTGTLWEGRYRATLIEAGDYLLPCMRYIELNPVRTGTVTHPSAYRWSSYRCNARGQPDTLVTPHPEYLRLGGNSAARQAAYRQSFRQRLSADRLAEIREATNKAWALGSARFKQRLQLQLMRPVAPRARGGDRRSEQFRLSRVGTSSGRVAARVRG